MAGLIASPAGSHFLDGRRGRGIILADFAGDNARVRLTAKLKKALLEGAEDLGTYIAAAKKAGISYESLRQLRHENPGLNEELEAAFDRSIDRDYQLARKGLRGKLEEMSTNPNTWDMPTARLALARRDRRWGAQYREQDVNLTTKVAVERGLEELDAETRRMDDEGS